MTNEEIIREIRKLADKHKYDSILTFGINYHMAFTDIANHIVEQEKENDKLKAEIKQLKEDYSVLARQYDNVENSSIRYYNEVKQLKSELERGVNEVKRNILSRRWIYTNDATPVEVLGMDWANRMNDWCVKIIEEAEQSLKGKVSE